MKILCHYFSVNYIIVADRSNWFVKQLNRSGPRKPPWVGSKSHCRAVPAVPSPISNIY